MIKRKKLPREIASAVEMVLAALDPLASWQRLAALAVVQVVVINGVHEGTEHAQEAAGDSALHQRPRD